MTAAFKEYVRLNCEKDGRQKRNLSVAEMRGLKSLKKRVREGQIVVLPTVKTGRFCIMKSDHRNKTKPTIIPGLIVHCSLFSRGTECRNNSRSIGRSLPSTQGYL